jgi:predicted transcriptional regulator
MKAKRLKTGELEARVMDVLWDHGGWLAPGEVHQRLAPDHEVAYTTVMTILVRLHDKGVVERQRDGRAFAYHPVQSREERAADRMAEVLGHAKDPSSVLSQFVARISDDERAQLRRMLKPRR